MQTAVEPVRNQAGVDPGQGPATSLMSIAADMMSLIIHVQAGTLRCDRCLAPCRRRESPRNGRMCFSHKSA
jgi:hypothetical protein